MSRGAHRPRKPPRVRPVYIGRRRWIPILVGLGTTFVAFAVIGLSHDPTTRPSKNVTSSALGGVTAFEPYSVLTDIPAAAATTPPPVPMHDSVSKAYSPAPHVMSAPPRLRVPQTAPTAPAPRPTAAARTGTRRPLTTPTAPPTSPPVSVTVHAAESTAAAAKASPTPTASPTAPPSAEPTAPTTAGPSTTPGTPPTPISPDWRTWLKWRVR